MKNAKKIILDVAKEVEELSGRKYSLFEEYKSETIGNIDEAIKSASDEDKEQWLNIKKTLSEKKYNKDTLIDDVLKFVEIQKEI